MHDPTIAATTAPVVSEKSPERKPARPGSPAIRWSTTIVVILLAAVAAVVSYRHAYEVIVANGETGWVAYLVPLTIDGLIYSSSMVLLFSARRDLKVPRLARFTLVLGILATLAANVAHGWTHGPVGAIVAAWPAVALVLSYELLMGLIRRTADTVPAPMPGPVVSPVVAAAEEILVAAAAVPEEAAEAAVPDVVAAVPAQVGAVAEVVDSQADDVDDEPVVQGQVQAEPNADLDAPYRPVAVASFLAEVAQGEPPSVRTIKERMSVGTDRARRLQAYLGQLVEVAR